MTAHIWVNGIALENVTCSGNWREIRVTRCRMGAGAEEMGRSQIIKIFLCHSFPNSSHENQFSEL